MEAAYARRRAATLVDCGREPRQDGRRWAGEIPAGILKLTDISVVNPVKPAGFLIRGIHCDYWVPIKPKPTMKKKHAKKKPTMKAIAKEFFRRLFCGKTCRKSNCCKK